jgi:hypothetical protein
MCVAIHGKKDTVWSPVVIVQCAMCNGKEQCARCKVQGQGARCIVQCAYFGGPLSTCEVVRMYTIELKNRLSVSIKFFLFCIYISLMSKCTCSGIALAYCIKKPTKPAKNVAYTVFSLYIMYKLSNVHACTYHKQYGCQPRWDTLVRWTLVWISCTFWQLSIW